MRAGRFLFVAAAMMVIAAAVIPGLTAPAERSARSLRQRLAVRLDSLTRAHALNRRDGPDAQEAAARIEVARAALAEADDHLAAVETTRQRYWSIGGSGSVLVGFALLLGIGGVLARRW